MISSIISRVVILVFGTLYPAYASYKAVRTASVKEYVKWMMYWIVFAFFTCIETFTDIFLAWFPFYYEIKVITVLWLLSPVTKGSSTLYRKFVHPMLTRREQEIDEYINQAKEKGYSAVLQLGSKGVNYATTVIMQTAIKGGGSIVQTLKKSYSLSDLSSTEIDNQDTIDGQQNVIRRSTKARQMSRSTSNGPLQTKSLDMGGSLTNVHSISEYNFVKSTDDISSGYSSLEAIPGTLSRSSSVSSTSKLKGKPKKLTGNPDDTMSDDEIIRQSNHEPLVYPYQNFILPYSNLLGYRFRPQSLSLTPDELLLFQNFQLQLMMYNNGEQFIKDNQSSNGPVISSDDDDDIYHDMEDVTNKNSLPVIVPEKQFEQNSNVVNEDLKTTDIISTEKHQELLTTDKLEINLQSKPRPVIHKKGRAPAPPIPSGGTSNSVQNKLLEASPPTTVNNEIVSNEPAINGLENLKPNGKEEATSVKRSFLNILPSIFRSDSTNRIMSAEISNEPSTTTSKETDI